MTASPTETEPAREMAIGDHVLKVKGYQWPGVIVADFANLAGQRRLVVECTVPEVAGALHIYNADQLQLDPAFLHAPNHLRTTP